METLACKSKMENWIEVLKGTSLRSDALPSNVYNLRIFFFAEVNDSPKSLIKKVKEFEEEFSKSNKYGALSTNCQTFACGLVHRLATRYDVKTLATYDKFKNLKMSECSCAKTLSSLILNPLFVCFAVILLLMFKLYVAHHKKSILDHLATQCHKDHLRTR